MNFMILSSDPVECARMHPDKIINSQIKEAAQMLFLPFWMEARDDSRIEKQLKGIGACLPTHEWHPCTMWVRRSQGNYYWAYSLFLALLKEKRRRWIEPHEYEKFRVILSSVPRTVFFGDLTPFAQAMPDECKVEGDAVAAYREYFRQHKRHYAKWYGNQIPKWWY